jgi:hypothetical protein
MPPEPTPSALPAVRRALSGRRVGVHRIEALGDPDAVATVETVDQQGLRLHGLPAAWREQPLGRYVWLDLGLDDGEPLRALGEILPDSTATGQALDIRFKHLFPDHRRRLLQVLTADVPH